MALMMVAGITLLDIAAAKEVGSRHARQKGSRRMYYDRSGYPKGMDASRGIASRKKGGGRNSRRRSRVGPYDGRPGTARVRSHWGQKGSTKTPFSAGRLSR
jgi:hypothetical protein